MELDDDLIAASKQVQDMGLDPFDWDAPRGLDGASQIGLGLTRPAARVLRTASLVGAGSLPGQVTQAIAGEDVFDPAIRFTDEVIEANTPDVATMGAASRTLSTASELAGTLPFLFGSMPAFLTDAAVSPGAEALQEGASLQTAAGVGAVQLGVNAVGLRIPNAFGQSLAMRMTTGAASNLALGAGADAASAGILEAGGADELAASFDWSNLQARGLDTALGLAFGVHAHVEARMTRSQRNAVLTANNADHLNRRSLPGVPVSLDADVQHARAMQDVLRQLDAGEPIAANINPDDFILRPDLRAPTSFDAEVESVLRAEGGFVDDPVDRGGATNFGISSRAHPGVDVANLTREQAKAIYRRDYWDAIGADALPPSLRGMAFDAAVNQGAGWTRQALAEAGGDPAKFLQLREARYREIVANDPSQAKFLRGWLNRLGRFKETNPAGTALRDRLVNDPDALLAAYAKLEDSKGGTVLNTDTARELSPEYLSDRTRSADVHEAASDTIKTLYEAKLAAPTPEGFERTVLFTAGGTGAGKTTAIQDAGDFGKPEIVYDTNMNTLSSAVDKVEQALAAGRDVRILYVYRDPVEALTGGAIPRAQRQAAEFGSGRTVPLDEHARTHQGVRPVMEALAEKYRDDPRVDIGAIDNSHGKGNARPADLDTLPRVEDNSLRERLQDALEEARGAGLAEDLYRGFSAAGRPEAVGAGGGGQPEPQRGQVSSAETPLLAAQRIAAESPDVSVIDGFDADSNPRYRPLAEALDEIETERVKAARDAEGYVAAVSCFLRRGGDAL